MITISVPHAGELGVSTPQDDFIFLYACEGNRSQDDCAAFTKVSSVKIGTGLVQLPVYGNADWPSAKIFKTQGWYTFLMAKNLETENTEMSINRCAVYYTGDK